MGSRRSLPFHLGALALSLAAYAGAALPVQAAADSDATPRYRIRSLGIVPGYDGTLAQGMNDHGTVVGIITGTERPWLGFIAGPGPMRLLRPRTGFWSGSAAYDVNNQGVAVGSIDVGRWGRPALFRNGAPVNLFAGQDDLSGFALAINDAGTIVGQVSSQRELREHVFIFDGGQARYIDVQGGVRPVGYDINEHGEVVIDDTEAVAAYVYGHGTLTRLPQPFGEATTRLSAYANNDAGQVVGGAAGADGVQRAYVWSDGRYAWLQGRQGETLSTARDINDLGWVVGSMTRADGTAGNFLARDGTAHAFEDLLVKRNAQQWSDLFVARINDAGQIAGYGRDLGSGFVRAFIATPVPEPHSWALMLAGVGLLGMLARRRAQGHGGRETAPLA